MSYLLIPLGGLGVRFKELGYSHPKPLINVLGKPIITWLLDNLNLENIIKIIIPYNKELHKYNFEDLLKKRYPNYNFEFVCMESNTGGATETVLITLNKLELFDKPILLLDGDNFYNVDIINKWEGSNKIFVFNDNSKDPIYSYIITSDNTVLDIVEKEKVSNYACTGAYGFNSVELLKKYCDFVVKNNIRNKNEFYISTTISTMIKQEQIHFDYCIIDKKDYICLGTPLQLRLFCNNYPKVNALTQKLMIKPMRYCFDLDNTLVTFPSKPGDYTTVRPIHSNINFLRYLKKFGHTIIIYTARKMNSSNGNIGKVNKDIGKITFDTLDKFNIPYDEIYFGKPYADYYIDDLAVNPYLSLEKELGFYQNNIDPREFNLVTKTSVDIIEKKSDKSLNGEVYYYNNIHKNVKDLFPIMFNYDNINYKWYNLEYIEGIPISKLYISQELTINQFDNIINSIKRLHDIKNESDFDMNKYSIGIDIYDNYTNKMSKRYKNYDYSIFQFSKEIFEDIVSKLEIYKKNNIAKISVIHGDPVFTNILINNYGKIKFIDMRGKIGDKLTIIGDELYDWSKIYQSLIGYDEILENKTISSDYKKKIISHFENKINELYGKEYLDWIKIITKSLLFSLIPLHNNQNCVKFFNLINQF